MPSRLEMVVGGRRRAALPSAPDFMSRTSASTVFPWRAAGALRSGLACNSFGNQGDDFFIGTASTTSNVLRMVILSRRRSSGSFDWRPKIAS